MLGKQSEGKLIFSWIISLLPVELKKSHTIARALVALDRQEGRGSQSPLSTSSDLWNKIIMKLQPQSSKQNYLLRVVLRGNRNNKSWKEAIGFDEVCLCLAKTFSFLRVSWKCLLNIPGLVFLLKYSSVFYLNNEEPNSSLRYACKNSHINQKNCMCTSEVQEVSLWYVLCFLRSKIRAQASSCSQERPKLCMLPLCFGVTNIFHFIRSSEITGYTWTIKRENLTFWFMRHDER